MLLCSFFPRFTVLSGRFRSLQRLVRFSSKLSCLFLRHIILRKQRSGDEISSTYEDSGRYKRVHTRCDITSRVRGLGVVVCKCTVHLALQHQDRRKRTLRTLATKDTPKLMVKSAQLAPLHTSGVRVTSTAPVTRSLWWYTFRMFACWPFRTLSWLARTVGTSYFGRNLMSRISYCFAWKPRPL